MYLQITTKCNMHCDHCCYSCGPYGRHMSMEVFEQAIELAAGYEEHIAIGGGEPTLHPNFWEILMRCVAQFDNVWLATNGSQTKTALALASLARKGVIGCALSQDEFHDPIEPQVIAAFSQYGVRKIEGDGREIRDTSHNISATGRALKTGVGWSDDCACSDIIISPSGVLYACGCKKKRLGTVFAPRIPDDFEWGECYGGKRNG